MNALMGDLLSVTFAVLFLLAVGAAAAIGFMRFLSPTDSDDKWLWDEEDS